MILRAPDGSRLERGDPPMVDLPSDGIAADRAAGGFSNLRLPDEAGFPLMADACGDWFRALVAGGARLARNDPEFSIS